MYVKKPSQILMRHKIQCWARDCTGRGTKIQWKSAAAIYRANKRALVWVSPSTSIFVMNGSCNSRALHFMGLLQVPRLLIQLQYYLLNYWVHIFYPIKTQTKILNLSCYLQTQTYPEWTLRCTIMWLLSQSPHFASTTYTTGGPRNGLTQLNAG